MYVCVCVCVNKCKYTSVLLYAVTPTAYRDIKPLLLIRFSITRNCARYLGAVQSLSIMLVSDFMRMLVHCLMSSVSPSLLCTVICVSRVQLKKRDIAGLRGL